MRGKQFPILTGLFLFALALRVWGICWGAPERIDLHPDEIEYVMGHALTVSFHNPDPHFLNYPSFLIYVIAVANGLLVRAGLVKATWQSYVVGRSIVATLGALTVPAVYWLASDLGGSELSAALSALWVALLPVHVWESHFAVTDVVMTFWVVAALVLSVRLLRRGTVADYAWTGIAIGLAVASKYPAALVCISPLVASLLGERAAAEAARGLVVLGIAGLAACFVGTPFTFLHFSQFVRAMTYEYHHVHSLHYGFSLPAVGWQYHKYVYELFASFPFSLGFALYAAAAAGAVWTLAHLRREILVVLAFAALYFAILGHWTFTPLRYQLPVVVLGAAFAGLWQGAWLESGSAPRRAAAVAAVGVTLVYTGWFTISTTARLRHDTRIEAAHWLDRTLQPGERLLACGYSPYLAIPANLKIKVVGGTETWIGKPAVLRGFDLVEITSLLYWRHERHQNPAFLPVYRRFRSGESGFHLVKRFEGHFLNRELYRKLDPMFAGYFVSPTLEFYAKDRPANAGG